MVLKSDEIEIFAANIWVRALKAKEELKKMSTDVDKSVVKSEVTEVNKILQGLKESNSKE